MSDGTPRTLMPPCKPYRVVVYVPGTRRVRSSTVEMPKRLICSSLMNETARGVSSSDFAKPNDDSLGPLPSARSGSPMTVTTSRDGIGGGRFALS